MARHADDWTRLPAIDPLSCTRLNQIFDALFNSIANCVFDVLDAIARLHMISAVLLRYFDCALEMLVVC